MGVLEGQLSSDMTNALGVGIPEMTQQFKLPCESTLQQHSQRTSAEFNSKKGVMKTPRIRDISPPSYC